MAAASACREKILRCLGDFLESTGRQNVVLYDNTHLTRGLGLSSDEGVDFVLDLCRAFAFDFPKSFNPFVHDDGRRGRRIHEMVAAIAACLPT